jgi:precorrin-6B methylase 2
VTTRRPADFSLDEALASASFTPRRGDLGALLERLAGGDEVVRDRVERAVQRLGPAVLGEVLERVAAAAAPLRGRLVRLAGRLAAEAGEGEGDAALASARARIVALLPDPDPKTRRNAILALARLPGAGVEAALLGRWAREERPEIRRSIADVLGRVGGAPSLTLLGAVQAPDDPELARILERAVMRLGRTVSRPTDVAELDPAAAPPAPVRVALQCREGLEPILCDELARFAPRATAPGRVELELKIPLAEVLRARTWMSIAFPLPDETGEVPAALARALTAEAARRVWSTWGERPLRWRLVWAEGGPQRARVLACARAVAAADASLVNDPTGSAWEVVVSERGGRVGVELVPRLVHDTRFAWRRRDVPAASHPTIAAALARVAGVRPDDVVWDPFVGSGLELVERAKLGPSRAMFGTDTDARALEAARENLRAAGIAGVRLAVADATRHVVKGVTLVITNPPMGRRVARGSSTALLEAFVAHVGEVLAPGGRLVWLCPSAKDSRKWGRRASLELVLAREIDMGGFTAELQVWRRP